MLKILKTIIICLLSLGIMGVSILYGFSSFFAPPNMDETLIPDAASQFYDINGNAIYTTLSEERRIPLLLMTFLNMFNKLLSLSRITVFMNMVVLTIVVQPVH